MSSLIFLFSSIFSSAALAAGGGHHEGVPWSTVAFQAINLSILLGFVGYKTAPGIKKLFADRADQFKKAAEESASALVKAQAELSAISQRMNQLEANKTADLATAKAQGEALAQQLEADAQALALRIKNEAEVALKNELAKAVKQIRHQMVEESLNLAKHGLQKDVSQTDHSRLQNEFVKKFEAGI